MIRREVLDDDQGHCAVGGQVGEEFLQGFEAAGRAADADDGEGSGVRRRNIRGDTVVLRAGPPAQRGGLGCGHGTLKTIKDLSGIFHRIGGQSPIFRPIRG